MDEFTDFPIDFFDDTQNAIADEEFDRLYDETENRLMKLAKGNTDITGATITISQPAENKETSYVFEVTIVLTMRPTNIAATEFSDSARGALQGAFQAVERQVRQKREKLRGH